MMWNRVEEVRLKRLAERRLMEFKPQEPPRKTRWEQ